MFAETDKKCNQLEQHLQGMSKTQGLDIEEFFLSSLQKTPKLGEINFDIVLENGNSVGIVEVKTKAKLNDLNQLDKLLTRFETFYTTHAGMKKYGVISAKIMPENVEKEALSRGFFVLK
ncbi:TPA: hypothetical protein EYP45_01855 [Candidatus Peregrinibacteria bacterium]|nr:hypothetical protein [Candidatus Peregrinibacteria bacterium]HIQ57642.1 hypothetical protein [Candidatus Gracilibacteria bacterium]